MKKLLIGFLTLATTAAFGQVRRGNDIVVSPQFGAYGGLSVASQWGGGYNGTLAGGIAGIQGVFPISWGWYVQPEITYSNMGTQFYYNDEGEDYKNNVNMHLHMNYLSVPVLFKWSMPFTGFGILFGPQYSFLLNGHQNAVGYQSDQYQREDVVKAGYFHRSDFSGVVGLEYYFPNNGYYKGPKFGFGVRYQFGLININNSATLDNSSITNNGFFVTGGIRF